MPRLRPLVLPLFCLLLAACASSSKSLWDMSESQRNRAAENGDVKAVRFQQSSNYYDKNRNQHLRSKEDIAKWIRKGAELGDGASQYRMAYLSLYADADSPPIPHNPVEALRLAKAAITTLPLSDEPAHRRQVDDAKVLAAKAETIVQQQALAEKGDANAMYALSQAYLPPGFAGYKSTKAPPQQEQWLLKAAEAGQAQAVMEMASRAKTPEEKLAWQQKAAAGGTPEAMVQMGDHHRAKGDNKAALEWYRKAAAKGSEPARKAVAQLTDATALRLQATAATGDAEAMYQLGEYFRAGNWAGKDAAVAQNWYLNAAGKGHVNANYQAALGSAQTADKSRLMRVAATGGHADALKWVADDDRRIAAEKQRQQQQAEEARRQAEAKRQQQIADQQAFVARIDREGTIDSYEAEVYCRYGGRRCDEMRRQARVAMEQQNRAAEAANMRRIQNLYSDGKSSDQRNMEYRNRSECMQKKTESLDKYSRGQQSWYYGGECK